MHAHTHRCTHTHTHHLQRIAKAYIFNLYVKHDVEDHDFRKLRTWKWTFSFLNFFFIYHIQMMCVCECVHTCVCVCVYVYMQAFSLFSCVQLLAILWPANHQAPLSRNSPGKNTGVGCHVLLQGTFLTQGLNPHLLHCRQILYPLSHLESQFKW